MSDYTESLSYETFIRRAHKSFQTSKNGADSGIMNTLIQSENGMKLPGLSSKEKQLEKVKTYIIKAFDKFLKMKITSDEQMKITQLKSRVSFAHSSTDLLQIVNSGLEATQRLK